MQAQLQLDGFALEELIVESSADHTDEPNEERSYKGIVDYDISKHVERPAFRVRLTVEFIADMEQAPCGTRRVKAVATGMFSFGEGASDELVRQITPLNQLAILYGMVRGIVASATGPTRSGAFILPSVNFVEIVKGKVARLEAERAAERVEASPPKTRRRVSSKRN